MPTTLAGLVLLFTALLPGLAGDRIFRTIVGYDWREREWQRVARIVSLSTIGLMLYAVMAAYWQILPWIPSWPGGWQEALSNRAVVRAFVLVYLGQWVSSTLVSVFLARLVAWLDRRMGSSPIPDNWPIFVKTKADQHWVLLTLVSGETMMGILESADANVEKDQRDIILREPLIYDEQTDDYRSSAWQHLFLPGGAISSIATLYDPSIDERKIPVGFTLTRAQEATEEGEDRTR